MGFLGFGNHAKPGPGIKKDGPQKKRFFAFFDLYKRKLPKLIQLNLLYLLFCIPIITIGPATAAFTKIIRYFNEEKPVFLFSDFMAAFKENFAQSLIVSILEAGFWYVIFQAFTFYYAKIYSDSPLYWILLAIIGLVAVIELFAHFYLYLVIVSIQLRLWAVVKNAFSFAFLAWKTNFITLFFLLLILIPIYLLNLIGIALLVLIIVATIGMIVGYNTYPYVYRFLMKPYYDQNGLKNPYEPDEETEAPLFQDAT